MSKFKLLMVAFLAIGCGICTNSVVIAQTWETTPPNLTAGPGSWQIEKVKPPSEETATQPRARINPVSKKPTSSKTTGGALKSNAETRENQSKRQDSSR